MSKLSLSCESWKPLQKNTLQGFATIEIGALALRIHDIAVHRKGNRTWAALPAKPWLKGGVAITDDAGKIQYSAMFEFTSREVADAFSRAVARAVEEKFPGALALEAAI